MIPNRSMISRFVRGLFFVFLAGALAWVWFTLGGTIPIRDPGDSPAATGLVVRDLAGGRIGIEEWRGQIVVLNLWASWCGPCVREIPALSTIGRRYGGRGVRVVGLNADEVPPDEVARIAESLGVDYEVVVPGSALAPPFETRGIVPHTWIVDAEGRVRASHAGAATVGAFDRAVRKLLDEG